MSEKPTTAEIEANLGLVHKIVHSHVRYVSDLNSKEDLISWGVLGLIHALKHFKPELGYKFSSYGSKCILGYMLQGMRSVRKEHWYMRERGHKTCTLQMDEAIQRRLFDEKYNEDLVIEQVDLHTLQQFVEASKGTLTSRQREIVTLMMANDFCGATVAEIVKTTRQNVNCVWNMALGRMKTYFEENHNGWTS